MLSNLYVGLIAIACDMAFTTMLALIMRPYVDKNHDGRIEPEEVTRIAGDPHEIVDVAMSIYDIGTVPMITVLLNSWQFAFAYGLMAVLTCNLALPADSQLSWLATLWITFLSLIFMCAFNNNGIHVATSHAVHFVYYLCGFIPMALFKSNPEWWVLVPVIVCRLGIFVGMKFYVWPGYPQFYELDPLFIRNEAGQLAPFSTPATLLTDTVSRDRVLACMAFKRSSWSDWSSIQVPFPVYEIANINFASWFTLGACLAWILFSILSMNGGVPSAGLVAGVMVCAVVLFVGIFVWVVPFRAERLKWITLGNYYPRVSASLACILGAGLVTSWLLYVDSGHSDPALSGVLITFHILGMGLYLFGYGAAVHYFGFSKSLKRLFSIVPGHGGVFIHKQGGNPIVYRV